jgi:hypothetical protein
MNLQDKDHENIANEAKAAEAEALDEEELVKSLYKRNTNKLHFPDKDEDEAKIIAKNAEMEANDEEKLVNSLQQRHPDIQTGGARSLLNKHSEQLFWISIIITLFIITNAIVIQIFTDKKYNYMKSKYALAIILSNTFILLLLNSLVDDIVLNIVAYIVYFFCVGILLFRPI